MASSQASSQSYRSSLRPWLPTNDYDLNLDRIIGLRRADEVADQLGIVTVGQFLHYLPKRYQSRSFGLQAVTTAELGEAIVARARIEEVGYLRGKYDKNKPIRVRITDGRISIWGTIFGNFFIDSHLHTGTEVWAIGTLDYYGDTPQLKNMDLVLLDGSGKPTIGTGALGKMARRVDGEFDLQELLNRDAVPIYRGAKKLPALVIAGLMYRVLHWLPEFPDPLAGATQLPAEAAMDLNTAIRQIHFPDSPERLQQARQRLAYNEALRMQLLAARRRRAHQLRLAPVCPANPEPWGEGQLQLPTRRFVQHLPFELTTGQEDVIAQISSDLGAATPMNRLLQGEVGSGKTVIAVHAMLQVAENDKQSVLLAPTEVLAAQHARSIQKMLDSAGIDVQVTLLTGSLNTAQRRQALLDVVSGSASIIVGTHALFSEGVEFFDLALVVIDEQHRFGVQQRDLLRERSRGETYPHMLVMTATPIPRTIAMSLFGDMEISTLTETPAGRQEVQSFVVGTIDQPAWEYRAWQRIAEELDAGGRAFIVAPKIASTAPDDESVESLSAVVAKQLPNARVAIAHGQLPGVEKDAAMRAFATGECNVLLATTVIEVGVDVPEATVMMIRAAESFGLSQLHQLRGRIGRGTKHGICFLCTRTTPESLERRRLEKLAQVNDGFQVAELDLATRDIGNLLGVDQSGHSNYFQHLDFLRDAALIEHARDHAEQLLLHDERLAAHLTADITEAEAEYLDRH